MIWRRFWTGWRSSVCCCRRQTVTSGNIHDSRERDRLLLGDEAALYADAAYSSRATRDKLARLGIADSVQCKGYRNHPSSAVNKRRNAGIAVVRLGVERTFAIHQAIARDENRPGLYREYPRDFFV